MLINLCRYVIAHHVNQTPTIKTHQNDPQTSSELSQEALVQSKRYEHDECQFSVLCLSAIALGWWAESAIRDDE